MSVAFETSSTAAQHFAAEILSDDQIEELLLEAEARLRAKAGLEPKVVDDELTLEPAEPAAVRKVRLPKLQHGVDRSSYLKNQNGIARTNSTLMVPAEQRKMADGLREVSREVEGKKLNDQTDAGSEWYNLPKTELTSSLKRDLQLIEMRNVLDPHRHYKKNTRKGKVPTFSQVGTVIEGPTEWYSSRINKKDRSRTFVDEEMKNESQTGRFKRKYLDIQEAKTSGKKAHYKKLLAKRKKGP